MANCSECSFIEPVSHPQDYLLREDRIPHIWCPGCGIGIAMHAFLGAVTKSGIPLNDFAVVSGIGCTGRVAGYVKLDSFHTTHGRALPFATGLKLANPKLKVIVFSGDGDLVSIGGNHFIHAARRNIDITVICVNNFIYGMTGGQVAPTTPVNAVTSTTPRGNYEVGFNLAYLAAGSGAVSVSRWTVFHVRQLGTAIQNSLNKKGFSFIEVISPCPTLYGRMNKLGAGIDMMKYFRENSVIDNKCDPKNANIDFNGKIVVGDFVNIERPTFSDLINTGISAESGKNKHNLKEVAKKIES